MAEAAGARPAGAAVGLSFSFLGGGRRGCPVCILIRGRSPCFLLRPRCPPRRMRGQVRPRPQRGTRDSINRNRQLPRVPVRCKPAPPPSRRPRVTPSSSLALPPLAPLSTFPPLHPPSEKPKEKESTHCLRAARPHAPPPALPAAPPAAFLDVAPPPPPFSRGAQPSQKRGSTAG